MSTPSHDTIATHVEHLMGRVEKLEAKIDDLREIHSLPNAEVRHGAKNL